MRSSLPQTRSLTEDDIAASLDMGELIQGMERALKAFSARKVVQPLRQMHALEDGRGFMGIMPVLGDKLGLKVVTFVPGNAALGKPTHLASILLMDPATGAPLAWMDGRLITEMRTAAVSAVATKLLSRPDATILGVLGSGAQARAHIAALRMVRSFQEVRVWSRTRANAEKLARASGAQVANDAEQAVRDADVVVTATSAVEPVLFGRWLKPGVHVNAIGWHGPDGRELDEDAMKHQVFVESREEAKCYSGNLRRSRADIVAELGEILGGDNTPYASGTTIFSSVGMAVEDIVAAELVLARSDRDGYPRRTPG